MIVCRLCLIASHDVIHIFREVGVQLKVSSILSKHFGSLFEVTEEHDEAICESCWSHTESFHVFYQSIKSAQNCYSSEDGSDDGMCQVDGGDGDVADLQHQQQNVKIVMYDSATNEVIGQRHDDSDEQQHQQHQHQQHQQLQPHHQQQQQQHQQHQQHQHHHYQQHGVLVDGSSSSATGYDTYEVCEQTNDSSELDLLMMIHPNEAGEAQATDDNGHQQHHQQQHHHHQHHMVSEHDGMALEVDVDEDLDDDVDEQPDDDQQMHHQQHHGGESLGMDPIMGSVLHRTDSSSVMSDFLQNNEHITVIEVSSPSQAQKLLQQQQQQQLQLQQLQQQRQPLPQPPPSPHPTTIIHHQSSPSPARIVQRVVNATSSMATNAPPSTSTVLNHAPSTVRTGAVVVQAHAAVRKRKMPPNTIAVLNPPAVGAIVQRPSLSTGIDNSSQQQLNTQPSYIDSEPESPPDTPNTSGGSSLLSPTGGAAGEPYRMQCDMCSKTFKTFHRVQTHYQQKHNMNGYVMCCGDQFFEKDLLVDHILMHVNNRRQMKKITCVHCEQFFYRKRFYTRHLLKVHNIGTTGNSSDPDSPTPTASANHTTFNPITTTITTTTPSALSSTPSIATIPHTQPASTSVSTIVLPSSAATPTIPPTAAGQRPLPVIRRIMNTAQPITVVTSQSVAGGVIASTSKAPMIVSIQSIVPKVRTYSSAATTLAHGTQVTQMMRTTPTAAVSGNNGAGNESTAAGVDVKYVRSDAKDDLLILDS